jgi:predicted membrane GTPase involved in stress response
LLLSYEHPLFIIQQDIQEAHAGEIVAVFGVECSSGDTFTNGSVRYTMTSMNVPEPVMSLAIAPASKDVGPQVCLPSGPLVTSSVRLCIKLYKWEGLKLDSRGAHK